jgi:Rrf2 family protein
MQLPQTAEYALRAMAYMATLPRNQTIRSKDLSEATGIPAQYLSKVLRRLVVHSLLKSAKGHGGGFSLALPKDRIRYLDIFIAVGLKPTPDHCVFGWGGCDAEHPCPLHTSYSAFNNSFLDWATTTTLAHVETRPERPS